MKNKWMLFKIEIWLEEKILRDFDFKMSFGFVKTQRNMEVIDAKFNYT